MEDRAKNNASMLIYVSPARCSSCTGKPYLDSNGVALFCEDCDMRAHAELQQYDIGRGGQPEGGAQDAANPSL